MYMYNSQYDEPYCEEECYACTEKEKTIDDVKYWLTAVIDTLYSDDPFEDLEFHLEELAHCLGMKIPKTDIRVVRKNRTTELSGKSGELEQPLSITYMLDAWKDANTAYLKSLTYTGAK